MLRTRLETATLHIASRSLSPNSRSSRREAELVSEVAMLKAHVVRLTSEVCLSVFSFVCLIACFLFACSLHAYRLLFRLLVCLLGKRLFEPASPREPTANSFSGVPPQCRGFLKLIHPGGGVVTEQRHGLGRH